MTSEGDALSVEHAVQEFLNEHRDHLTDRQIDDFYARFSSLRKEVESVAECDHENVVGHIPPDYIEREGGSFLSPSMETGTVAVFHGKCEDCGAEVDTMLELTADTGGDDADE